MIDDFLFNTPMFHGREFQERLTFPDENPKIAAHPYQKTILDICYLYTVYNNLIFVRHVTPVVRT
jgi:hypothetical protein